MIYDKNENKNEPALTPRWTRLRHHPVQSGLWRDQERFKVVPAGRRSGKTELAKRHLVKSLSIMRPFPNARFAACAPTRDQAKRIFWADLKLLTPPSWISKISEGELWIKTKWGYELWVIGMDKPERIEGTPWDGIVLDEYGNMKAHAWDMHVRPALSTEGRPGWAWLIGVPEGRNHYYDKYVHAMNPVNRDWAAYTWKSEDILAQEEIDAAKAELDPITYAQEYEGAFEDFQGRVYYQFTRDEHVRVCPYDSRLVLWLCLDFNVAPGVAAIIQEQAGRTCVIDEIHIPKHSNTPMIVKEFLNRYRDHPAVIRLYGDATGGSRGTAQTQGTDWDIIRNTLKPVFGSRLSMRVPKANPAERARVNAMNSRLKSVSGDIRMLIDPKCINVIKDFEGVRVLEGTSGEIDKKSDPTLTHLTDAIGYAVVSEYPVTGRSKIQRLKMVV